MASLIDNLMLSKLLRLANMAFHLQLQKAYHLSNSRCLYFRGLSSIPSLCGGGHQGTLWPHAGAQSAYTRGDSRSHGAIIQMLKLL